MRYLIILLLLVGCQTDVSVAEEEQARGFTVDPQSVIPMVTNDDPDEPRSSENDLELTVPSARYGQAWDRELDTAAPGGAADVDAVKPGDLVEVRTRSIQLLRRRDQS